MVRKIFLKLFGIIDFVKDFLIVWGVKILIVIFIFVIMHNIIKISEISSRYQGEYKNLVSIYEEEKKFMNYYSVGEGDRTIVILPEYATQSPVLKYKALADKLSSDFKVVIVEYLGYGFSLSTKEERSNEKIVGEVREGLQNAGIFGPYILMPFEMSNIYASYYAKNFPEEVSGIISVDGMYAEAIENENFKDEYLPNLISNVKFYSTLSLSGIFRWDSYLNPDKFNIDKMANSGSYGKEEIKVYRNLLANKFLTKAMKNEINKLKDNMKEVVDYKYQDNIPTLQILTTDTVNAYKERNEDINSYAKNLISNKNIQYVRTIDGKLDDYLYGDEKLQELKNLIRFYF